MNKLCHRATTVLAGAFCCNGIAWADKEALFGQWGSESQCARALIAPKGSKFAAPFGISADWLEHGDVWCRLNWKPASQSADRLFAFAYALCGEDAVRGYSIKFYLSGSELTIHWNDSHEVGPLRRCGVP